MPALSQGGIMAAMSCDDRNPLIRGLQGKPLVVEKYFPTARYAGRVYLFKAFRRWSIAIAGSVVRSA